MRYGLFIAALAALVGLFIAAQFGPQVSSVTAQDFVDLQQGSRIHEGFRRAHAKGICIAGEFRANGALAQTSRAQVFQAGHHPFIGRFSIAGNNPLAPDLQAPVRSLAFDILPNTKHSWRSAMNTPPVLAVATPEAFYQQLQALRPDPETGRPNSERLQRFFATHPESAAFLNWRDAYQPSQSFTMEHYHSTNAFYLVNSAGERQAVRWIMQPTTDWQAQNPDLDDADALQQDLQDRVAQQPVRFDLILQFAVDDDPNDPTREWSAENPQTLAGQLVISQVSAQQGGVCDGVNFDPLVLPDGIEPSNDKILRARSAAYAESYKRRAQESWLRTANDSEGDRL